MMSITGLLDFVFFDAAHELDLNQATFEKVHTALAPDAIIAIHDTGTWARNHFAESNKRFAEKSPATRHEFSFKFASFGPSHVALRAGLPTRLPLAFLSELYRSPSRKPRADAQLSAFKFPKLRPPIGRKEVQ